MSGGHQPFRLVRDQRPCEWPGCTATIPYRFGRPRTLCDVHRGRPRPRVAAPTAPTQVTLSDEAIIAFLGRPGVLSVAAAASHRIIIVDRVYHPDGGLTMHERVYERDTLEAAVRAALPA